MNTMKPFVKNKGVSSTKEPITKENPHVHRFTSYVADLKNNWAYVGTNREPRFICPVG